MLHNQIDPSDRKLIGKHSVIAWVSCSLEIWPKFARDFGDFESFKIWRIGDFKNIDDGDFSN